MSNVYGIDLGTTYSAISFLDDGLPKVIENLDGSVLLPSAVYFPEDDELVVGELAKNHAEVEPHRVVQMIKREIGKEDSQVREFNGKTYNPIEISALILRKMVEYAKEKGHDVKNVVITCPAYFGNEERNATRQAGESIGLNVLNIVNEPTAAAFNYLSREIKESRKIMVYDLGGGTFDVTLFDYSVADNGQTTIDVIDSGGNDKLGGADWDQRLYNYVVESYIDENGSIDRETLDNDGELKQKIRSIVEITKKQLSEVKTKKVTITYNGDITKFEISREKFEEMTKDLVDQTINYVRTLLSNASLGPNNVDIILLVGGSTFMPMIREAVEQVFPGNKVRFEEPNLAVAKGAALAAGIEFNEHIRKIIKRMENLDPNEGDWDDSIVDIENLPSTVKDVQELMINTGNAFNEGTIIKNKLSHSFGPGILDENRENLVLDNLIFVGDESPSEVTQRYSAPPGPSTIETKIYENVLERGKERIRLKDSDGNEVENDSTLRIKEIGKVVITLPANRAGNTSIELTFRARTGGLDVIAINPETGESFPAFLDSQYTMTVEELENAKRKISALEISND